MSNFFQNKKIQLLLVFLFFFGLVAAIQFSTPNLLGCDPYYHIKQAYLIRTEGLEVVKNFPWLKFTTFSQHPTDLSFLFHIILIPFTFGNLIWGGKLAACLFASLIFVVFFFFLKRLQIKFSFLWTFLLLIGSIGFLLRINLLRPHVISISLTLLAIYFFFERKYIPLFITCFIFILSYSGWEAILLPLLIYLLIQKIGKSKVDFKLLFSCISGFGLGILFHPNFPHIIYSMYVQNFLVLWHRIKNIFPVGAEMYPPDLIKFALASTILILLFGFCFALVLIHCFIQKNWSLKDKKIQKVFFLGILSLTSLMLIGGFQRLLEYWVPFTILFSAFTFDLYLKERNSYRSKPTLKRKTYLFPCLIPIFVLTLFFISLNLGTTFYYIKSSTPSEQYKEAALWLKNNTPKNSVIFHSDWSIFPKLFFWNHHNYYIVGMDPTFMYEHNKDLWEKYKNIEENLDEATQIIREDFDSEYVFLSERGKELAEKLDKREDFEKVYEDKEVKIYKLKN